MATEYGGYMGKILQIDLSSETAEEYPFTDHQRLETLGGKVLAFRILSEQLTGDEKAFSEENPVILSTGPLTGTGVPGSNRFEITTISPKSRMPVSSNCGGSFGVLLKKAGFDALILRGRCKAHRWLEISEAGIRFHDAEALWGTGTAGCFPHLTQHLPNHPFGYICIGPAGEELLPSATVISGGRSVGKAGFGAVLGWKNLKAITVSGNKSIPLSDPGKTAEVIKSWNHHIQQDPLTSDPEKTSNCPGCPIRCKTRESLPDPAVTDMGLDFLDASQYSPWLLEKLGYIPEFSVSRKHGKRRDALYRAMLQMFALTDCESSFDFYQNLAEGISALGLCIFTIGAATAENSSEALAIIMKNDNLYPALLLHGVTGVTANLETLLAVGKQCKDIQNQLCRCFKRNQYHSQTVGSNQ